MPRERVGFAMQLNEGAAEEYRRRHDAIWPELSELLRNSGISNYSIFLDERTHTLFAYLERGGGPQDGCVARAPDHAQMVGLYEATSWLRTPTVLRSRRRSSKCFIGTSPIGTS